MPLGGNVLTKPGIDVDFNKLTYANFQFGDRLPLIAQRTLTMATCNIDAFAGRYIVLCFYGSAADAHGRAALDAFDRRRRNIDTTRAAYFFVSIDPTDEIENRVKDDVNSGIRVLCDYDFLVSRTCGAFPRETPGQDDALSLLRQMWIVIDPMLHVLKIIPFASPNADEALFSFIELLPPPARYGGIEIPAPILLIPNVFEPEFCHHLIKLYEADGGSESGVMRNDTHVLDLKFKRRRDFLITEAPLIRQIQSRIIRRVIPDIERLFFMQLTRMERYLVSCYDAKDRGHFQPHRDNGPGLTEHRRYAVSINLNREFEGGQVSFPEYNTRGYKAPPGWALVFPCNILHAVATVRSGKRYAFLPFVYDEAGRRIRDEKIRQAHEARQAKPS